MKTKTRLPFCQIEANKSHFRTCGMQITMVLTRALQSVNNHIHFK